MAGTTSLRTGAGAAVVLPGAAVLLAAALVWASGGAWASGVLLVDPDGGLHPPDPAAFARLRAWGLALAGLVLLFAAAAPGRRAVLAAFADDVARARAGLGAWWRTTGRLERGALLAIVALGAVYRLRELGGPMRADESISYSFFSSRPLLDVLSDYATTNNHVLYNALSHLTIGALGASPVALRLPALLFGLALIPATYALARRLFGAASGLGAAGLIAGAPWMIRYSTEARGYALVALAFVAVLAVGRTLIRRRSWAAWAVFVVVGALGLWAVPTMLYGLSVASCWMLLAAPRARGRALLAEIAGAVAATAALAALFYLPVLVRNGPASLVANRFIAPLGGRELAQRCLETVRLFGAEATAGLPALPLVLLALGAVFALRARRATPLALGALAGVSLLVVAQRTAPAARMLTFLLPPLAGLAAAGLAGLAARVRLPARTLVGLVGLAAAAVWPALAPLSPERAFFADVRAAVERHEGLLADGDALVAHRYSGVAEAARYYLVRAGHPPTRVHKYDPGEGPARLARYRSVLVVVRASSAGDVAVSLEATRAELAAVFAPPVHVGHFDTLDVYRLVPLRSDPSRPPVPAEMWYPQVPRESDGPPLCDPS